MEYRKKCNTCGKIFCYTDKDLRENESNAAMGALESVGSLASMLGGGTIFHTQYLTNQANRHNDKVVDYNKCPNCNSSNVSLLSADEWEELKEEEAKPKGKLAAISSGATPESLLKRAMIFLEDGEWASARAYCEACLDMEPENAQAYLGKLMAKRKVRQINDLGSCEEPIAEEKDYEKIMRFGDESIQNEVKGYNDTIIARIEEERLTALYNKAERLMDAAKNEDACWTAARAFQSIAGFKDADEKAEMCKRRIDELREEAQAEMERKAEEARIAKENEKANKERIKKKLSILIPTATVICAVIMLLIKVIIPGINYKKATVLLETGQDKEAIAIFAKIGGYKDSAEIVYSTAVSYKKEKRYVDAIAAFLTISDYKDSEKQIGAIADKLLTGTESEFLNDKEWYHTGTYKYGDVKRKGTIQFSTGNKVMIEVIWKIQTIKIAGQYTWGTAFEEPYRVTGFSDGVLYLEVSGMMTTWDGTNMTDYEVQVSVNNDMKAKVIQVNGGPWE